MPSLPIEERTMGSFDYGASAELFAPRSGARRKIIGYRRFETAAEAIRFAIEELRPEVLGATYLEVEEERYDAPGIRQLYASDAYPLPRRTVGQVPEPRHPV